MNLFSALLTPMVFLFPCLWFNMLIIASNGFVTLFTTTTYDSAFVSSSIDYSGSFFSIKRRKRLRDASGLRNLPSSLLKFSFQEDENNVNMKHNIHETTLKLLVNSERPPSFAHPLIIFDREAEETPPTRKGTTSNRSFPKRKVLNKLQRFSRFPAWPLTTGMQLQAISRLTGCNRYVAEYEDMFGGGSDCPNIFVNTKDRYKTSPFLMFVHHNHSFDLLGARRWIEKSIIPEGFPSHAHRGMMTVTICLRGGLLHRDSLGIKQNFGAESRKYSGKHTQALNFGAGVVHELMWDNRPSRLVQRFTKQEIYQIWIDLPSAERMSKISVDLIGGQNETPIVIEKKGAQLESRTTVIAGCHQKYRSAMKQKSDFTILLVTVEPGMTWRHSPPKQFKSTIVYMRHGSAEVEGRKIPRHCTSFLSSEGDEIVLVADQQKGADFLFLCGQPLDQNIVAQGSMVGESIQCIDEAVAAYNRDEMGKPWDENLSDDDWKVHVDRYPCKYDAE